MATRSSASLTIAPTDGRPPPPARLSDRCKALWTQYTQAMPPGWFAPQVWPLLEALVAHIQTFEEIEEALALMDGDAWETWFVHLLKLRALETARIASLSARLGCTPRHTTPSGVRKRCCSKK